ncbi:hypothetical protein HPP92_026103 [Vanilla planifolia]|uniref:Endonuclease/exonuclease/phosphatase domain-containing protein n=1 Tax=Vanilla planifolia TaxID=51239 RepID=A0A835U8T2_VANPL|nr:hypothetical protein HPP92_026103 [Vanilla planifolia]
MKSRSYLRRLIRERNVTVVALMETKAVEFSRKDANWLLGGGWDFEAHPSEGLSAGFLILWRKEVELVVSGASSHTMACTIKTSHDGRLNCYFVYGPRCHHRRRIIWEDVRSFGGSNEPLLVAGDFNLILAPEEKQGGRRFLYGKDQQDFADIMQELQLVDLGFSGNRFTWSNGKQGGARILERLDRALMNSAGLIAFPNCSVQHLSRLGSDHCPWLVKVEGGDQWQQSSRLLFDSVWLDFPQSFQVVEKAWRRNAKGDSMEIVMTKFKRSIWALRRWSRQEVGNIVDRNKVLEQDIDELQNRESSDGLSDEEHMQLGVLVAAFHRGCVLEEQWWWQRAKVHWAQLGIALLLCGTLTVILWTLPTILDVLSSSFLNGNGEIATWNHCLRSPRSPGLSVRRLAPVFAAE